MVLHSHTKHVDILHHFSRDHEEDGEFVFEYVETKNELAYFCKIVIPRTILQDA